MKKLFALILTIYSTVLFAQNKYEYRIPIDNMYETYHEGEDIVNHTENDDGDFVAIHQYFIDSETQEFSIMKYAANGNIIWRKILDSNPNMIFTYISPPEICSYADRYAMVQNQVYDIIPTPLEPDPIFETYHTLTIFNENGETIQEHTILIADQQQFTDVTTHNGGFVVASTNVQFPIPPPVANDPFFNRLLVYTTDINGNPIWEKQILFEDYTWDERLILYETITDVDNNIYLFCSYEFAHDGLIIIKLDEDGEILFVNKYEDPELETWGYDPQCRATINDEGDLFCYFSWQNNPEVAQYTNLYKFNKQGDVLFSKRVEELVFVSSLTKSSDNGFTILFPNLNEQFGPAFGNSIGDSKDPALAKFNSDGSFDWGYTYGEQGDDLTDRHITCQDRGYMIWSHTAEDFYMIKTDIDGNSNCDKLPLELNTIDFDLEITTPIWTEIEYPEEIIIESEYFEEEPPELLDKCCLTNLTAATFDFEFTNTNFEISFINNSINADSYAWDFGDGSNAGYENPVHIYPEAGDYTVCLTVYNECMDNQHCVDITVPTESTVGLNEVKSYASIYPNPTSNVIEIESKTSIVFMQLSNHQGQLIRSVPTTSLYQKHQLNELPKGIYFMELSYKNGQKSHHKIILQ